VRWWGGWPVGRAGHSTVVAERCFPLRWREVKYFTTLRPNNSKKQKRRRQRQRTSRLNEHVSKHAENLASVDKRCHRASVCPPQPALTMICQSK